jgi:eukaryotic-like serine/threonine-protein kinase
MATAPQPTMDLTAQSTFNDTRARYDAAWHDALVSGGAPPDREPFLVSAGSDRELLATFLDSIDSAYLRLRDLIKTGAVSLSPNGLALVSKPVDATQISVHSEFAATLDSVSGASTPKSEASKFVDPTQVSVHSEFAATLDSVSAGKEAEAESEASGFAATIDAVPRPPKKGKRPPKPAPLEQGVTVGGYELLGVIAHGGMGVVYKARHTRLDRLAAIKMVLAGAHASPDQLARFRAEAQVVASLQHPNIVQLYEVGEHDHMPYIALEFVEGGSLASKAGGRPQPPREAASLIEVMARAMDYAHENGVVHRDLKPANVLLTAGGAPKVTDFGLAKRLESDSGQTRTGTLMGTPSYMAPEQAAGKTHEISPLTDVYALGAILYELLTGVPPFSGRNPSETIIAVLKTDPVSPRRLQANTPQDLDTICLKCLEKEPAKRYGSAAELADDLRRFLAGDTIRARPVGSVERLWRWCRRNPGIASLSAAVLVLLTTVAGLSVGAAVRIRAEKQVAEANAAAAIEAQRQTESALLEAKRLKGIAEQNEAAARTAQTQAENDRAAAEKARKRADAAETVAAAQLERALKTLGDFVTIVQDQLDNAPGTQKVKKDLLELALGELRAMAGVAKNAGGVDLRLVEGYRRFGELAQRLGDLTLARQQFEEMDRIARQHLDANPDDPASKRVVSVAEGKLGDLFLLTGDKATARRHYEEALRIRTEIAPTGGMPAQVDLAQVYVKLANVSSPGKALGLQKDALRLREAILNANTSDPNARRDVRVSHYQLADAHLKVGDPAAALSSARKAVELAAALDRDYKNVPRLKEDLARAHAKLGDVYRADKRTDDARKEYEAAVRIIEPLAVENQQDLVLQITSALFLAHSGRHADAAKFAARVVERAPKNAFMLFNAACVYSIAAEMAGVRSDADLTPEDRKLVADYGEAALRSLKAALNAKYPDHDQIRTDPDLAAVRKLPGFAEIAKDLRPPTAEADR